uniref:Major facilitator superfamily associated domain-containing protein n=1 Tax=Latimeria chalumnae TaxID=7897 RepID=H3AAA5_LATCH
NGKVEEWHTSSRLIFVRLFLFCLSAARFSLFSFLPIYFHSWGISALEFGCLYGMKQLVSMLLLPLLLKLVAKSKLQTCIVFFMILGAFAVVSLLVWSVNPYQGNTSTYCGQTNVTDSKVRAANLSEVSLRRGFFSAPDKGKEINTTEDLSKVQPQNNGASFALDREKGILKRKHSLPPFLSLQHKAQRAGQWLPFLFDGPNRFTTAAKNTRAAAATSRQSLKQKPLQRSSARKQYGRGFHVRRGENAPLVFSKVSKRSNSLQDWYIQQDLSKLYETYLEMMGIILVSDCLLTSVQFITEDALWDFLETTDLLAQHDRLKRWTSIGSLSASVVIYFVIKFRICWRPTVNPFVFHVICSSIFAICAMGILFSYPVDYFTVYTYHRSSVATAMKLLFCDIRNSPYIFVGLFTGFLSFGFDVVQIWYLCDMGGPAIFIASLLLIQCLVELLMHRTCHKWKRPILPYHWMHCLTIVAIGLRSMAYYFIRSMWVFLPVEILFACSHTLVLITFEAFSEYISPPGVERSVRFLLLLFYSGPGMGLGACLGGFLYSSYGSRVFYGAHVGVTVVVLVLVLPLKFILPSRIYSFSRLL